MACMISERAERLLKTLVELYIADGQPVGSRTLSRMSGLDLSSASIRNVLADLEDMGLVASPHTSAGRIPTARGYRHFVDRLIAEGTRYSRRTPERRAESAARWLTQAAQRQAMLDRELRGTDVEPTYAPTSVWLNQYEESMEFG